MGRGQLTLPQDDLLECGRSDLCALSDFVESHAIVARADSFTDSVVTINNRVAKRLAALSTGCK